MRNRIVPLSLAAALALASVPVLATQGAQPSAPSTSNISSTPSTLGWRPLNPIARELSTKPTILARATSKFGKRNLNLATSGFKNLGLFVATMNVSNNLKIDFSQLKLAMTGTDLTGISTGRGNLVSLGQAIQQLKPAVNGKAVAARAERQAAIDID